MIRYFGYACINTSLKPRTFQTCRLKSVYKYGIDYLREKIINNLILTKDIILWNITNSIYMYRVTSQILPLVTHPEVLDNFEWRWYEDIYILKLMADIKIIVEDNNIRLSMHPDQFTVINSNKDYVVRNSIEYLKYHYDILKKLGGQDIIVHIGGVYGDKNEAIKRFIENFKSLDDNIGRMIKIENDDKSYNIDDIMHISNQTNIPVVFDLHHHNCNHINNVDSEYVKSITDTWIGTGMLAKMHISSGNKSLVDRKHSEYINLEDFVNIKKLTKFVEIDLMVEAKMKEQAVLRLIEKR